MQTKPNGTIHSAFNELADISIQPTGAKGKIEGNMLQIENIDIPNGTPLLDIKSSLPVFDQPKGKARTGCTGSKPPVPTNVLLNR